MCGIVAIVRQGGHVSVDALNRAVGALEHRGPDGQKTWVDPHGRVALGHARLSIIDLATGDQPIANEDQRVWIVANGEFYDYERVQDELEASGAHRLRTRSDSEIALHLYKASAAMRAPIAGASTRSRFGTTGRGRCRGARSLRREAALLTRSTRARCTSLPK